jgi:hypothetical protein
MANTDKLRKGDIGVEIVLDYEEDISDATVWIIYYRKPSGATGIWLTAVADGTTAIKYTTTSDTDLDEYGEWWFQGYIEQPGYAGRSTIAYHIVEDNITVTP